MNCKWIKSISYYTCKRWFKRGTQNNIKALNDKVDAVVGNSSSGIVEALSFYVPTINIGDRQKGRVQAVSICNCKAIKKEIVEALDYVLYSDFRKSISDIENPYGNGGDVSIHILEKF